MQVHAHLRILTINPGSTSTKIAIFENTKQVFLKNIKHTTEELSQFSNIIEQYNFRKQKIIDELNQSGIESDTVKIIMGRGGMIKPLASGVYEINDAMVHDLQIGYMGEHASNLGGLIAIDIARSIKGAKAYIADPVVVDELCPLARISGHPDFERISIFHALNQKAIARTYANQIGRTYEELNLIIAHLGGGISVSAHNHGQVIDTNNALNGDGPFSPERSGGLPVAAIVKCAFSGKYTEAEMLKMITGKGGLTAYLDTNDAYAVEQAVLSGDKQAKLILEALAYQVAKDIGAMSTVLEGQVNAILLTGGMAHGKFIVDTIIKRVTHISQIRVFPGEDEMAALALNGLMVAEKKIEVKKYK
ncbi:putative butyrate kinase [Bacteroidia bacterium]|nr:putative butyrate kinase [Bacteroidia bacterium]